MKTNKQLHGLTELPNGKLVGDLLEAFSGIKHEVFIGKPNPVCAGCRKPFDAVRKPRKAIRLYPVNSPIPIAYSFNICGHCLALLRRGGSAKDGVLAAVEAYCEGRKAKQ